MAGINMYTYTTYHCESTNEAVDVFSWSLSKHSALDTKQILWERMRRERGKKYMYMYMYMYVKHNYMYSIYMYAGMIMIEGTCTLYVCVSLSERIDDWNMMG